MSLTKRHLQKRINTTIALLIVLIILLAILNIALWTNSIILAFIWGCFAALVLYQFPWYKFK